MGFPKVMPHPTAPRCKFGAGSVGEVMHAADIKAVVAGRRGAFAAFALEPDIPALLRKGALEALGGQLDSERGVLTIRKHGADVPLSVSEMGRFVLIAVARG